MEKPKRYLLTIIALNGQLQNLPMWAFSAADAIAQYEVYRKGSPATERLLRVEPWIEDIHGPWKGLS